LGKNERRKKIDDDDAYLKVVHSHLKSSTTTTPSPSPFSSLPHPAPNLSISPTILTLSLYMASISPPSPYKLTFTTRKRLPYPSPKPQFPSRYPLSRLLSDSTLCRCTESSNNPSIQWRWDAALQAVFKNAIKSFDSYMNPAKKGVGNKGVMEGETGEEEEEEDGTVWDWDRWRLHFDQVDEQQRLVSLLKVKLVWGIIFFFWIVVYILDWEIEILCSLCF
jgi:hypothetical protein